MTHIRWMVRRDMPLMLAIDYEAFGLEHCWGEEDFIKCLRQRNCIGMVAENDNDDLQGFMIYELHRKRLDLLRLAVDCEHRRQGVATAMLDKLDSKLSADRRTRCVADVPDNILPAHLLFKASGWIGSMGDESRIIFERRYHPEMEAMA